MNECSCGRPVHDATLCARCGHLLDAALAEITEYHGLGWDLDLALARQVRIERPPGIVEPDQELRQPGTLRPTPSPYDHRASDAAAALRTALFIWVGTVVWETRATGPAQPYTIAGCAAWLRPRAGWLRHHTRGGEALDQIRAVVADARRAIDRPADRLYAGPCQGCGTDLYARLDAAYVVCPGCETPWEVAELRAWLLTTAEDVLATTTELARALTRLAQPVTPSMIRGYVHRGGLAAHGQRMEGPKAVPLYRLGDVLDCVTRAATAKSERIGA